VIGDQQAALLGQQCFAAGQAKNTYGTGCFMLLNTGTAAVQSTHGLLTTVAFQLGPSAPCLYALEGSVAVAGVGVKWLKENWGLINDASEMCALVTSIPSNEGVYCVPAFSGLLSPYWRSSARGVITGLTLQATKAHLARAMLEATAYQTRDVLQAMVKDTQDYGGGAGLTLAELRVDGGMTNSNFLMQFQADQLDIPVACPVMQECTAAGAAFAAGLAVGFWTSPEHIQQSVTEIAFTTFCPTAPPADVERDYRGWRRALTKSLNLAGEAPEVTPLPPSLPSSSKKTVSPLPLPIILYLGFPLAAAALLASFIRSTRS
jgi:glycerol kinase